MVGEVGTIYYHFFKLLPVRGDPLTISDFYDDIDHLVRKYRKTEFITVALFLREQAILAMKKIPTGPTLDNRRSRRVQQIIESVKK